MENTDNTKVMSVGDWIITNIIASIPIVGVVMLLVWAFSRGTNPNKANWAKSVLIMFLIMILVMGAIMLFAPDSMTEVVVDTGTATVPAQ